MKKARCDNFQRNRRGNKVPKNKSVSLSGWSDAYLAYASTRHSSKTYAEKTTTFGYFFRSIDGGQLVRNFSPRQALTHLTQQAKLRSGNASNKDRKNLHVAWRWGSKYLDMPRENPFDTERFPENRYPKRIPTEEEFWRVYDAANRTDRDMLLTFLHTAGRRGEIFRLRWSDVDLDNKRIRLWTRKRLHGSLEADWLPLTEQLHDTLLRRSTDGREWVFPNGKADISYTIRHRWMHKLCKQAEVEPFGVHAIRHLTASILAKNNVPMIQIQAILRHQRLSTTERYLHRLGDCREAINVLNERSK